MSITRRIQPVAWTIESAGHFPWIENPDAVRPACAGLTGLPNCARRLSRPVRRTTRDRAAGSDADGGSAGRAQRREPAQREHSEVNHDRPARPHGFGVGG